MRSIAVLPFRSLKADGSGEYLGLGIADALITRMSAIRQIAVRPTTAVRAFAPPDADPVAAGRSLKVDAVVEGSIHRERDRVRVTVRLLDVADGRSRWAATFDERLDNLFAIEDSISERVAAALAITLLGDDRERLARRDTTSPAAHRAHLEGRFRFSRRTKDDLVKAVGRWSARSRSMNATRWPTPGWPTPGCSWQAGCRRAKPSRGPDVPPKRRSRWIQGWRRPTPRSDSSR